MARGSHDEAWLVGGCLRVGHCKKKCRVSSGFPAFPALPLSHSLTAMHRGQFLRRRLDPMEVLSGVLERGQRQVLEYHSYLRLQTLS